MLALASTCGVRCSVDFRNERKIDRTTLEDRAKSKRRSMHTESFRQRFPSSPNEQSMLSPAQRRRPRRCGVVVVVVGRRSLSWCRGVVVVAENWSFIGRGCCRGLTFLPLTPSDTVGTYGWSSLSLADSSRGTNVQITRWMDWIGWMLVGWSLWCDVACFDQAGVQFGLAEILFSVVVLLRFVLFVFFCGGFVDFVHHAFVVTSATTVAFWTCPNFQLKPCFAPIHQNEDQCYSSPCGRSCHDVICSRRHCPDRDAVERSGDAHDGSRCRR